MTTLDMTAEARQAQANTRGIIAMIVANALFCTSDMLSKVLSASMSPSQMLSLRGAFAAVLCVGVMAATGQLAAMRALRQPRVVLRSAIDGIASYLFIIALANIGIGELTSIAQSTPIIITALSVVLLGEKVGWRRWMAVLAGFIGLLLIVQPSVEGLNIWALAGLAVALLVAVRDLITRGIDPRTPPLGIALGMLISATVVGGAAGVADGDWHMPSAHELTLLGAGAAVVILANVSIVHAVRGTEMSVVSPFRYSVILWAFGFGILMFGERPNALSLVGTAIVVGSGVYTAHREAVRRREQRAASRAAANPA